MKFKKKKVTFTAHSAKSAKDRRLDTAMRRTIWVLSQLSTRGCVYTKELADKFGITDRQVLRDLDPMREIGVILENPSRNGRWDFNRASHSFIKMELTDSESSAMTFMYKFAKVFGGEVNASALRAIQKAFPVEGQENPFFMITQKVKNPAAKMPCHNELYDAILKHYKINLTYSKAGSNATVKASPFSMILCDGLWYLGYVPDGKGRQLRTLRSSNIVKVEPLTGETFKRPDWARKIMKGAKNIWFSPARNKLVLKADNDVKDYFDMAEYFPCQKIINSGPDDFIIEARYAHPNEVVPTILRFLPAIKVLEPAEIRDELTRRIKAYRP